MFRTVVVATEVLKGNLLTATVSKPSIDASLQLWFLCRGYFKLQCIRVTENPTKHKLIPQENTLYLRLS